MDAERVKREAEVIARPILNCYSTNHIDLHSRIPDFTLAPGEHPVASALARTQAQQSNRITNLMHMSVSVSDIQRYLLQQMDGTRDRAALVGHLESQVDEGNLVVHEQGEARRESQKVRDILEHNLQSLATKVLVQA